MSRRREFIIFVVLSVIGLVLNDGIVLALNAGLGLGSQYRQDLRHRACRGLAATL